ncbi:MAG TPA: RsmD family RNA methyltransferase [Bacteriovoracaceae bacterium]|nr:RsmD family RNA methyltransferase [Bacteriovoracaceae bacterium]
MSIKILGGVAKGFPLATPRLESTRPTSVMIKRKLFDWRQHLDGYVFIDLFAGSGAMGFEALSRGASKVYVNDSMKGAFLTLKDNKASLEKSFKFDPSVIKVTNQDAKIWLQKEMKYELPETQDCILYLDPPYENHSLYTEIFKILKEGHYLGEVWVESERLKGLKLDQVTPAFCTITKTVEKGDHFVVVGKVV